MRMLARVSTAMGVLAAGGMMIAFVGLAWAVRRNWRADAVPRVRITTFMNAGGPLDRQEQEL